MGVIRRPASGVGRTKGPRSGACVPHSGIGEFRNGEAIDDIEQRDFPFTEERNIQCTA